MPNAFIAGTGFHVPERVVTNDDLVSDYGIDTSNEWIVQRTGIEARRFAAEGVGTAALALPAAKDAIEAAGIQPADLDMIVFATLSPDYAFPGSGVMLQEKLGLPAGKAFVPCLDVRNQCSGFVYSLSVAASMVRGGTAKHVLVVGSEIQSPAIDLTTRGRTVSSIFGDGAGAAVVSATEEDRGVRGWVLGADGRHADALRQKVWDTSKRPFIALGEDGHGHVPAEDMFAAMDGKLVFKHAVKRMQEALHQVCAQVGTQPSELDLVFFHQANMRINQLVGKQLGLPEEKTPHNIQRYGNTTAATIPILLAEAVRDGTLKPGMRVGTVAFGSGFTWGAAIIDW
jgi:3-oxoacyl-[acyl-carrier-protein] synthase-3